MNTSLRLLPVAALLAVPFVSRAQNELSNFSATGRGGVINTFATDYQVIGINPANLGRKTNHKGALTIGETGIGVASQSLNKTLFKKLIYQSEDPITPAGRVELVDALTSENTLNANVDVTTLGFAIALPNGLGGVAVSHRMRSGVHVALNRTAADIIVNGKDADIYENYSVGNAPKVSVALAGTNMQGTITSEFNIAYGIQVLDKEGLKLSAGLGYRYIQGLGIADIRIEDGTFYGYNALSPAFKVNYGDLSTATDFNYKSGSGLSTVGSGHGVDIGLAAEVGKMLRLGVSVVDMGKMTWDGNVLTAYDQDLKETKSNGVDSYNVFEELANQFDRDDNSFTYEPNKERNGALPTKLRTGAGIRISELFEAGVDVTVPLNKVAGNLTSSFVGLGVDYKPVSWLRLSSGVTGGAGYGASLPLGVTFVTSSWEAGISSRDMVGLFSESSPYTSVAFGLLRFKFGSDK
ncbi:DUF5723 family protein [Hymenobacter sp. ASUV-10]|uniref:DUF5723 family protein n=1 Tax=Hymenobacter aranciens TaxID=3063996 RepID=A0ABT9BFX2_9BACT|nr:DUF5723 family protein [Hymenobacter sp. ASUV-10]MDO7876594.1 DUF5723 family protein [Hymenobacter sp. ASUV-10]